MRHVQLPLARTVAEETRRRRRVLRAVLTGAFLATCVLTDLADHAWDHSPVTAEPEALGYAAAAAGTCALCVASAVRLLRLWVRERGPGPLQGQYDSRVPRRRMSSVAQWKEPPNGA
ncbi:hypothetical protein [Streptomyces sp. HNM0574]|uniref:hypothetical protein n=1 Tax=Streptomyces sp. HNM0574 TaxID=2714954 RepID=UPI00146A5BE1|nr:hypothetical protein [Streptomyces sp. HNM0574]NLU70386.1 hypothetical protein [Streptomyces sp. HNM0574]